jgi:hypothetical protein
MTDFQPASRFAHLDPDADWLGEGTPAPGLSRNEWNALVDQARASDMLALAGARLRRSGHEFVGPCPVCGGHDRFAINRRKQLFNCRGCGKGGSPIDLEMFLSGCEFVEAVRRLTNTTSPSAPHRSSAKTANHRSTVTSCAVHPGWHDPTADAAQHEREAQQYEIKQHRTANWLWAHRRRAAGSPVEHYLRSRGYVDAIPPTVGYLPARGEHPHAMISAFALPNELAPGELGAPLTVRSVHLTKLAPDGSDRIREQGAKIIVGRPLGLPIAISPITDGLSLAITEGIEDALAYRAAGFAAWAAGSAPSIPTLAEYIPHYVTMVIIEQHIDEPAQRAAAQLQAFLHERPVREGERPIKIVIRKADK